MKFKLFDCRVYRKKLTGISSEFKSSEKKLLLSIAKEYSFTERN